MVFALPSYTGSQGLSLISRQIAIIVRTVASAGDGRSPFVTSFLEYGIPRLHLYTRQGSDTAGGASLALARCCADVAACALK